MAAEPADLAAQLEQLCVRAEQLLEVLDLAPERGRAIRVTYGSDKLDHMYTAAGALRAQARRAREVIESDG